VKKHSLFYTRLAMILCVSLFFSCTPEIEQPPPPNQNNSLEKNSSSSFSLNFSSGELNNNSSASFDGNLSSTIGSQVSNSSSSRPNISSSSINIISSSSSQYISALSSSNNGGVAQQCSETAGPVACYGKLKASGNKLIGSKSGSPVQVRGVSLFWSNTGWGGDRFFTATAVNAMVDDWKSEVIRVPIGYSESGGYSTDPSNLTRVKTAINAAIAKGVYVVIDWHSHNAHNELSAATSFFSDMAQTYGSKDHVIFELYNEPTPTNGGTWANIKTYANSVISTIRQYSDNLILVGTPSWDQEVNVAAGSQVSDPKNNIAYVFHFYAYSHPRSAFESNVNAVLSAGYPVFVSEYGTVDASGDGRHDAESSNAWHTYMDANKISSCAWSLNDKKEAAAFFGTGSTFNMSSWTNTSSMTASGQYIFNKLRTYANSAPWRGGSVIVQPQPSSSSISYIVTSSSSGAVSATRCKDSQGGTYFCEWGYRSGYPSDNPGCFAIDPTYDPKGRTSCATLVSECQSYGSLFVNSTVEGESKRCNSGSSGTYCLDPDYEECILMSILSSAGYTCSQWVDGGSYATSSSCPSGWYIYK